MRDVAPLETEIRQRIVEYLSDETSLEDFESWLVPATWDVNSQRDAGAADLAYATQLLLAERAKGHVDDAALHEQLLRLASTAYLGAPTQRATASSAITQWTLQVAEADRPLEAEFV